MNQVVLFGDSSTQNYPRIPSIYVLASYLRDHAIPTQTVWAWKYISFDEFRLICEKYITAETKLVGISTTVLVDVYNNPNWFYGIGDDDFKRRIELIKQINPNVKIAVGGPQVTDISVLDTIPCAEYVDFIVKGQGEESIRWILDNIDSKQTEPITDKVHSFDTFNTTITKLDDSDLINHGEAMFMEIARGCIFKCSFCNFPLTGKTRGDFTKTKSTLRDELISNYERFGIQYYFSSDDLINDSQEKVDEIYELSQSLPFKFYYSAYSRLDMIWRFPDMAEKLKQSGMISTIFGLETVNDKSGKSVGKGLGVERMTEGLEICKRAWDNEVFTNAGFILGLPHDTVDSKYELMDWLNLPIVRDTLHSVNVIPLGIKKINSADGISGNPKKFGYDIVGQDKNGRSLWMLNNSYTNKQAADDSSEVMKKFYDNKNLKTSYIVTPFNYPLALSLSDRKDDIRNAVIYDDLTAWGGHETNFISYIRGLFTKNRVEYMSKLIGPK